MTQYGNYSQTKGPNSVLTLIGGVITPNPYVQVLWFGFEFSWLLPCPSGFELQLTRIFLFFFHRGQIGVEIVAEAL